MAAATPLRPPPDSDRRRKREKKIKIMAANWADLPEDLLGLVLLRLDLTNRARLITVCKQWRSAAEQLSPIKQSLILMRSQEPDLIRRLLSPLWKYQIIGSFGPWLVMQMGRELTLLNPTSTSEEAPIKLPPLNSVIESYWSFHKVILSSSPQSSTCTFVFKDIGRKLFSCKLGDVAWTPFYHAPVKDVMFFKNRLYAIAFDGVLKVFDSGLNSNQIVCASRPRVVGGSYLVNAGDRLLVIGMKYNRRSDKSGGWRVLGCPDKVTHFKLYEVDLLNSSYVDLESIGDHVLFFSDTCRMYCSAKAHPELRPNHIYLSKGYQSVGAYSLDDKAFVTLPKNEEGDLVFFQWFLLGVLSDRQLSVLRDVDKNHLISFY